MNNKTSIACLVLITAFFLFSCQGTIKEKNTNNASPGSISLHEGDDDFIAIDTKKSVVMWRGSSVEGAHTGYVYISQGELKMKDGELTGGIVEVNMSSIEGDDHRSDNNLIRHLKDPDFFDVKKFPFSAIAITNVTPINDKDKQIMGNLTIKGITHPVSFPANVVLNNGMVKAGGRLVIDRTKWDVRYNSGKFYDNLADKTIADSIELYIKIVSKENE